MIIKYPSDPLENRPLHIFLICDCSGSMAVRGKIQSLNNAIRQVIPLMREAGSAHPNAQILIRVLQFSKGAQWRIAEPTPIQTFEWVDLVAGGMTDMGTALSMVAEQLDVSQMSHRAFPPVLVLISDGHPSDNFKAGLQKLKAQPWGRKAVRVAIAIGQDADQEVLQAFIDNPALKVLPANSPDALLQQIQWVFTRVVRDVSMILSDVPAELDNHTGLNSMKLISHEELEELQIVILS